LLAVAQVLCACSGPTSEQSTGGYTRPPSLQRIAVVARSWHLGARVTTPADLVLLRDGAPFDHPSLAVARSIQLSNPRIVPFDALYLADIAVTAAEDAGVDPEFFCATILQESAFDPTAVSSAGAVGIAQFTIGTADASGVDPFDVQSALYGSAQLLREYLNRYRNVYDDPYAATLAAYNAGPQAVATYHGVPPYAETRAYISYVYERWARLLADTSIPQLGHGASSVRRQITQRHV